MATTSDDVPDHTLSRRMLARGALATAAIVGATAPARADTTRDRVAAILPDLTAMLQDGMGPWHIPGMAVGVVAGQDIVLAQGFGHRTLGAPEIVDADTMFQIGSTTKAFTATAEAILVDQGKLGWMDRVIDHDPDFRLFDPWVTREFRIVDLLAQRSGLRPYVLDLMWILGYSAADLVAALRHVEPVGSFRADFAYQNILHQVAGRIAAKLAGVASWDQAVGKLILDPLGMTATTSSAAAMLAAPNRATGHAVHGGEATPLAVDIGFPYVAGPAGGLNSNVADMTRWLRFLIGRGEADGKRLLAAHALETTWKPRVEVAPTEGYPWVWQGYASGWISRQTERGVAIWHNGGTPQFRTHVGFVPALGVGIVVLSNEGANDLVDALGLWFYDRLLGNPPDDYAAKMLARSRIAAATAAAKDRRPPNPAPSGATADYAGTYRSAIGGIARVAEGGQAGGGQAGLGISFETPRTRFGLSSWSGDVFAMLSDEPKLAATLNAGSPLLAQFQRTAQGVVETLRFDAEADLVFHRDPTA